MANCGENTRYKPYVGSCVISAATSFNEADRLLNDKICQILNMWVSGITCTNESSWIEDGMNRKLQVDARLSHGKYATMTDEDLYTENIEGAYIDPTNTEFTDTNALRIVCLSEGSSGITPSAETVMVYSVGGSVLSDLHIISYVPSSLRERVDMSIFVIYSLYITCGTFLVVTPVLFKWHAIP